jgi:hypothetical protein
MIDFIKDLFNIKTVLIFLAGITLFIIGLKIAKKILWVLAILIIIAAIGITIIF